MAAVLSRTIDPLTPLLATLARLDGPLVTGLSPSLRVPAPIDGWISGRALLDPDSTALDELLDTAKQRWNAAPHAAAALAWKCYSYWTSLPAVLSYAVAQRVPLMTPDAVAVRLSQHQPFLTVGLVRPKVAVLPTDPIALTSDPDIVVVPDLAALRGALRSSLVDAHFEPLLGRLRSRVHVGRRTLWGSVASGVAHGLSRAADALPCTTLEIAHEVLTVLDADDLVDLAPASTGAGLDVHRRTCCLAFTLPEPTICTGCVIRPHD